LTVRLSARGIAVALLHSEKVPSTRDTLEVVFATRGELDTGAGDQIGHRARDEDLARFGGSLNPCRGVHGDSTDVLSATFDLTGVDPDPKLELEAAARITDRPR